IIDEGQDCTVAMARLAIALVGGDHRRLTVLADPAQCIYPNTYRWARQEFAPRGAQNIVLRVPYRSTKQVYTCATSLFDGAQEADRELLTLNDPPRQGPIPEVRVEPDRGTAEHALLELVRAETCGPESGRRLREVAVLTTTNRER